MRARRNSRADCSSFFGLFVDVVYRPPPARDLLPCRAPRWLVIPPLLLRCRPSRFPRWHSGFPICPRVSANWLWDSTLFIPAARTDGPGTPFSSNHHHPHQVSDVGPSGSSRLLAASLCCLSHNLKAYSRRSSETTLLFRVTGRHLVPNPSSTPHMKQTNRCSVDLEPFSGTPSWSPSLPPADSRTSSVFSSLLF